MKGTSFVLGVAAGMAGAAAAVIALEQNVVGTQTGYRVSQAAHRAAGTVSSAAQDAANVVDRIVK